MVTEVFHQDLIQSPTLESPTGLSPPFIFYQKKTSIAAGNFAGRMYLQAKASAMCSSMALVSGSESRYTHPLGGVVQFS